MATSTLVSLSEYLTTSYRPDCDWMDGELKERNMGEGPHSLVQGIFVGIFRQYRREWQIRVHPEQRVQTSPSHYRVPDVCVVRADAPFERIMRQAPLLCIEIFSWDDRMIETQQRVDDYLAMGVSTVWLLDPRRRMALNADAHGSRSVEELVVRETAIRISVAEIFDELAELERQQR